MRRNPQTKYLVTFRHVMSRCITMINLHIQVPRPTCHFVSMSIFSIYLISTWFRFSLVYRQNCHEQVHCPSPGVVQGLLEGLRRNTWALKETCFIFTWAFPRCAECMKYQLFHTWRIWDWSISSTNKVFPHLPHRSKQPSKAVLPQGHLAKDIEDAIIKRYIKRNGPQAQHTQWMISDLHESWI